MSRIAIPSSITAAPAGARPVLQIVEKQLGVVPNLFRLIANNPAVLTGYTGMNGALAGGRFDARTRERLALVVAESNRCDYCLSAHWYLGKHVARLDDAELAASREAGSSDPKVNAALRFAARVLAARGHVSDADLAAVRAAGHDDAEIIEIVAHVAINVFTNYLNSVAETDIDFPVVTHRAK